MVPNRFLVVAGIAAEHPEAFAEGANHDATRLDLLRRIIIPELMRIDGDGWGYLTKTDQRLPDGSYKVPCDIVVWRDTMETVDCLTSTGACWIVRAAPPPAWIWTPVQSGPPEPPTPTPATGSQAVFYTASTIDAIEGTVMDLGDGTVALILGTPGAYVSVQPDGTFELRGAVGPWERARRVGPDLLCFDGTGTSYYVQVFDRRM